MSVQRAGSWIFKFIQTLSSIDCQVLTTDPIIANFIHTSDRHCERYLIVLRINCVGDKMQVFVFKLPFNKDWRFKMLTFCTFKGLEKNVNKVDHLYKSII